VVTAAHDEGLRLVVLDVSGLRGFVMFDNTGGKPAP
jgi:hypothetical protein